MVRIRLKNSNCIEYNLEKEKRLYVFYRFFAFLRNLRYLFWFIDEKMNDFIAEII